MWQAFLFNRSGYDSDQGLIHTDEGNVRDERTTPAEKLRCACSEGSVHASYAEESILGRVAIG